MINIQRLVIGGLVGLVLILYPSGILLAADGVVNVPAGKTLSGSTFLSGQQITIDGTIDGDLYVAGDTVSITGEIKGDIIAAAKNMTVSGPVYGDIRVVGQSIRLTAPIAGSVTSGSQSLLVDKTVTIGRDLVAASSTMDVLGNVNGKLYGAAEALLIGGRIGKDVYLSGSSLTLRDGAYVGGNLTYRSTDQANISSDAVVQGDLNWNKIIKEPSPARETRSPMDAAGIYIIALLAAMAVYLVGNKWRRGLWSDLAVPAGRNLLPTAGIGLLLVLALPLAAIILMVTVIGIPLSMIMLGLYSLFLYCSKFVVTALLAGILGARYGTNSWMWVPILAVLMLVSMIPLVGWIIKLGVVALGMGSVFYALSGKTEVQKPDLPTDTTL